MRRREFITLVGGAVAWPVAAGAQEGGRGRRVGMLEPSAEFDPRIQLRRDAIREALAKHGWIEGRNIQFYSRATADEIVGLAPDVIYASGGPTLQALLQRTRTIPVVFSNVGDPVAIGLLKNVGRPEGNATGITNNYDLLASKWVELLKEAAPRTSRVALIFFPDNVNDQYFDVIDASATALGMKAIQTPYRNADELQRAIDALAAELNGSVILVPPPPSRSNRQLIIRLALKHRLPTIYASKDFPYEGGLLSYASDGAEQYQLVASYIDRLLRGAKVSELPVQFPTKFELVINLKTAKAIGLTMPEAFLLRADEIIE